MGWYGRANEQNQPHREFIYRMAFELGRHIIGYEVQKILVLVDWMSRAENHPPIGVIGYGEGALLALYMRRRLSLMPRATRRKVHAAGDHYVPRSTRLTESVVFLPHGAGES